MPKNLELEKRSKISFSAKGLKSQFCNLIYRVTHKPLPLITVEYIMHILQPKTIKLKPQEVKDLLEKYNISLSQLPKIKSTDPGVPEGSVTGDLLRIERKEEGKINLYFRVVA